MARFVILEHDHPFLHWDFMLEAGDVLRTWRLAEPPAPGKAVRAEFLADHRRKYLDYEGPVSGNRGTVKRWDAGTYEGDLPDEIAPGQEVELALRGKKVHGQLIIRHQGNSAWEVELQPLTPSCEAAP